MSPHLILKLLTVVVMAGMTMPVSADVRLWVAPSYERVMFKQEVPADASKSMTISACRNEWESVQLIASGNAKELGALSYTFDIPVKSDGTTLPAAQLLWQYDIPVKKNSPDAPLPTGLYPDALIVFVNGAQSNPRAFRGKTGEMNFRLWVDFKIPTTQKPGSYRCQCTVKNTQTKAIVGKLTMIVDVRPEALPKRPALKSFFGINEHEIARINHLDREGDGVQLAKVMEDYYRLMMDCRVEPGLIFATSAPLGEDGQPVWKAAAGSALPSAKKVIENYYQQGTFQSLHLPLWGDYPFADPLGKDRLQTVSYMAKLARLNQKSAPDAELFFSVGRLDEPDSQSAYEEIRRWASLVHEASAKAETKISFFVTEQPDPQKPAWGTLEKSVDIWAPHVMWVWEDMESKTGKRLIAKRIAAGDQVWCYPALSQFRDCWMSEKGMPDTRKDAYPPVWLTDYPAVHFRILPWLCAVHSMTGIHYWDVLKWEQGIDPWTDAGVFIAKDEDEVFNGDGLFIYPPSPGLSAKPCASIRLKWIRDGMEDYDHLTLLRSRQPKAATRILVSIARGFADWETSPSKIQTARSSISNALQHP